MFPDLQLKKVRRELAEQSAYHKRQLGYLPKGKIAFLKNGSYVKWVRREEDAGSGGTIIYRKDRSFAKDLNLKRYHSKMANTLDLQIRLLDQVLLAASDAASEADLPFLTADLASEVIAAISAGIEYANKRTGIPAADAVINSTSVESAVGHSAIGDMRLHAEKALLSPALLESVKWMTDWCREAYECGDRHINELRVRAKCGLLVRSKSEAFIADWLFEHRIPFHYEQVLRVGDYIFCPDFTILLPDGALLFWEHFGALNKTGYLQDTQRKLARYLEAGIYPGRDLLITCEDGDNPMDLRDTEWILHMLCSKYMSAVPFGGVSEVPLMMK